MGRQIAVTNLNLKILLGLRMKHIKTTRLLFVVAVMVPSHMPDLLFFSLLFILPSFAYEVSISDTGQLRSGNIKSLNLTYSCIRLFAPSM